MKFYAIHEGFYEGVQARADLLRYACDIKGIEFICIDSLTYDYTDLPKLSGKDLLYNFARGSLTLESLLLNNDVTTFYIKNPPINTLRSATEFSIIHDKENIPSPKTIYHLTADRKLLYKYVEYLGGFPIIIKVVGGTRGIGTIKIENWHSIFSTIDYLMTTGDKFIMREFINANYGARILVLGEEIISSCKFFFQENDFRNAPILSACKYEPLTINKYVKELCVKAVKVANIEFAGVDLLFGKEGNPYLLEVNFPTGFQSIGENYNIPVQIVEYLIEKSKCNNK